MSRQRDVLVNFERMWREMDELLGSSFAEGRPRRVRAGSGFSPRVDVFYARGEVEAPLAVVLVELAGIEIGSVSLEVSGRELVIAGERSVQEARGRVYQQVEIDSGPFRRLIELGAEVDAERARASYEDGILRVELPLRVVAATSRRVPIEPADG